MIEHINFCTIAVLLAGFGKQKDELAIRITLLKLEIHTVVVQSSRVARLGALTYLCVCD